MVSVSGSRDEQTTGRRCLKAAKDDGVCARPVKFESGAWFLRQVQRAATLMPWSISTDKLEQIDEEYDGRDSPGPSRREAQNDATVREFLETLAAKLTGGTLEGTRVSPLYDHPAYERMLEQYHAPLRLALSTLANALRDALTRKLA
ncbi:putative myosin viia and rab [Operophtera brumata]|uniref:Putative myosin viia and rab n=1 Tax=Operophtera brumata TaxID=104452 RepID=A0A0L7KQX0_OPEBR|nr:putative myosin viia and rab [Operophtera brumata]